MVFQKCAVVSARRGLTLGGEIMGFAHIINERGDAFKNWEIAGLPTQVWARERRAGRRGIYMLFHQGYVFWWR